MENYWRLSGEIVRIKDLYADDNSASVLVRTTAKRINEEMIRICEMCVSIPSVLYKTLNLKPYMIVDLQGHFETQVKETDLNMRYKTFFIVDDCLVRKG